MSKKNNKERNNILEETFIYQSALDIIADRKGEDKIYYDACHTLQKLIESYLKLEKAYDWEDNVNANKTIDEALLNLDCWIDSNKEDGTTYNAIGWWNILETFKKLEEALDKACEHMKYDSRCAYFGNSEIVCDDSRDCKECWKERLLSEVENGI